MDINESNQGLSKKVREATLAQYNYMAVVGDQEQAQEKIDLRANQSKERVASLKFFFLIDFISLETIQHRRSH